MSVFIEINSCSQCPHFSSERDYTGDSWEFVEKWHCKLLNVYTRRYVDWNDHSLFIHKECPLPQTIQ